MGVSVSGGGGVNPLNDKTRFNPLLKMYYSGLAANSGWITLVNVTGKGKLDKCVMGNATTTAPAAGILQLRVTLDGTVIYLGSSTSLLSGASNTQEIGNPVVGIIKETDLNKEMAGSNSALTTLLGSLAAGYSTNGVIGNVVDTLPYNNVNGAGVIVIPDSLYFNNSLKVEIQNTNTSTGFIALAHIEGGIFS